MITLMLLIVLMSIPSRRQASGNDGKHLCQFVCQSKVCVQTKNGKVSVCAFRSVYVVD